MAKTPPRSKRTPSYKGRVRRKLWLNPNLLSEAQVYLGTANERETGELTLDLVAFRRELAAGAVALEGLNLRRVD